MITNPIFGIYSNWGDGSHPIDNWDTCSGISKSGLSGDPCGSLFIGKKTKSISVNNKKLNNQSKKLDKFLLKNEVTIYKIK